MKQSNIVVAGIRSLIRTSAPPGKDNDSEAVVFVHGNPGSGEDWETFIPQLGEFVRTVAPDMPGYGKAERPRNFDYTVDGFAQHLNLMLEALGVQKVHLVLHDFGGCWGMTFASLYPEKVLSLTMVNVGVVPGYQWHAYARIWRTPILGELFQLLASRWAFRLLLNRDNPKPFPKEFTDRMFLDSDWGMSRGMLKLYRATSDMGALSVRCGELLKERNLPALILWGEGDKFLSSAYAEVQKDYFDAQVHTLPGCGHWPMIDDPAAITQLLVPFLRNQCSSL